MYLVVMALFSGHGAWPHSDTNLAGRRDLRKKRRGGKTARRQMTAAAQSTNMSIMALPTLASLAAHYPRPIERSADRWVHIIGLAAAGAGAATLLVLTLLGRHFAETAAVGVYGLCLMTMLVCSSLYNMAGPRHRPVLRRLDHAAIFLMIAGSYTPFTTMRLTGPWAVWMTLAVWTLCLTGAAGKLFLPGLSKGFWVVLYLAVGWLVLIAIKPLLATVSLIALALLLAGGLVYSLGVVVYLRKSLPFRRAIWHGFVIAAAATHYVAILTGVVLSPSV
jgi:hemolysin III